MTANARAPVIVVGAGMAGLTAAVTLHEAGIPVHVFEAADSVGGRMRSSGHGQGFVLDRCFQVYFEAYPVAQRWIDVASLRARAFDATVLMWTGRRLVPLADPLRSPAGIVRDLTTSLMSLGDKLRLARLSAEAALAPWQNARDAALSIGEDCSGSEYLWSRGFTELFVDRVARPVWGGVMLDRNLSESAGSLLFTLKMATRGSMVLPAGGVGAIPDQLRARLPPDFVSLGSRVTSVVVEEGRVSGVRVDRRKVPASAVIVATDPISARKLTGVEALATLPGGVASTTVYLTGTRRPRTGPRLVFDATRRLLVNHVAPLSEVQPTYAPAGQHLIAAVIVGERAGNRDLESLAEQARLDAASVLGDAPGSWRVLKLVQEPHVRFAQPPGGLRQLPGNVTATRGLVLASEMAVDASANGAMISGETAAAIVQRELVFL